MKGMHLLLSFLILAASHPVLSQVDNNHTLLTGILQDHVKHGRVNYGAIKRDPRLQQYLNQLTETNPASIRGRNNKLAFWINAYNAFTLKVVVDNYPLSSIKNLDGGKVWDRKFVRIGGKTYSLNDIEHRIIRPRFKDGRVHYALVCAAKSCPPLRSEAFVGSKLNTQLNSQGYRFLRNSSLNRIDVGARKVYLSSIFEWFREDYPKDDVEFLKYLARYMKASDRNAILANPGSFTIEYLHYSWALNN